MQRRIFLAGVLAFISIAGVAGQAAATTSNPLNNFIGAAGAAASEISSANAKETSSSSSSSSSLSSSSSSPTSSPSTTATPAQAAASASHTAATAVHHGLSEAAKIGIIVGCVVGAVLILALLALCCCCVFRRRHRRKRAVTPLEEKEVESWRSPIVPGHHQSNYTPVQRGEIAHEASPTVPLMAAAAASAHHASHSNPPSLSQHPAMRQQENPFVPVPPSPRRTAPNSRSGLTDGMVVGADPYVMPEKERLRKSSSRSRSRSNSRPRTSNLPTHTDANRPPTPFGLDAFGTPATSATHPAQGDYPSRGASPPYSAIGQPYDNTHVRDLQAEAPSDDLRQSLQKHETAGIIAPMYDGADTKPHRSSRGYSTPPEVPSRSPNREKRVSMFADSSYDSSLSTTTDSNSSGGRSTRQSEPYQSTRRESMAPWERHQQRFSNVPLDSEPVAPPPIPWSESEYNTNKQRRQSNSPRQSVLYDSRRGSATSINGQPRRLRFADLQPDSDDNHGYSAVPHNPDSYEEYESHRWSHGVGEAL